MWFALFVKLSCTICAPMQAGQFKDEITCLMFVAHVLHENPALKAKCEFREVATTKSADGMCPKGKGWCCSHTDPITCRCKVRCDT